MHKYSYTLKHLSIPFAFNYEHNLYKRAATDSTLLFLTLNDYLCVGESTPREYVTGESTSNMPALAEQYVSAVLDRFDGTFSGINTALTVIPDSFPALRCLIESSLLSYLVQSTGKNLFSLYQAEMDTTLIYSASITGGSEKSFQQMAMMAAKNQMKRMKLKLTSDSKQNLSRVQFLKEICGDDVTIRMDGNEIWDFDQAKRELPQLIDAGVSCFEQLFPKQDETSIQKAFNEWGNDIELIADESITDRASVQRLIETRNVHGACLKIAKNGGLNQTLAIAQILTENDLSVRLSCHVGETSYLSALGAVFATLTHPIDLEGALSPMLLQHDPFHPNIQFGLGGELKIDEAFRSKLGAGMRFEVE